MNLTVEAVKAVQRGFHVFPVEDFGKTPHTTTPPYTIKWSDVATNDLQKVMRLWGQWPEANIGVACKPSGLLVVDCDIPKRDYALKGTRWEYLHDALGPLVDGETVFDQVIDRYGGGANFGELSATYSVTTGSGGVHYYYWWPDGIQASQASLVKGVLDIRCNGGERGGYVLGEGSCTTKGSYVRSSSGTSIMDAPAWLVELCRERTKPARPAAQAEYERGGSLNYAGLVDSVMYAQEGNRNNCLLWAARAMCSDGASIEDAFNLLGEAAAAAGLTGVETRDTIRSAFRLQKAKGT
jgi:hypothetical protein